MKKGNNLYDIILTKINEVDSLPFLFKEGQVCRILRSVSEDGQTPEYWDGAKVRVIFRYSTPIFKNHIYRVIHLINNKICEFAEDELDKRYIRK